MRAQLGLFALLTLLSWGGAFAQSEVASPDATSELAQADASADSDVRVEATRSKPSADQLRSLPGETWSAAVNGLKLRYHLVSLEGFSSLGYFVFAKETQTCHIYIDTWLARHVSPAEHLAVVFHEVGHCVDATKLRFSHNMFVREGCAYGAYYCAPAEGYAEAWRYAYAARCGLDAVTIGYERIPSTVEFEYAVGRSDNAVPLADCTLPLAEGVIPPLFSERIADIR